MVDTRISDFTEVTSPPGAGDYYLAAEEDVANTAVPASMVTLEHEAVSSDADKAMAVGKLYIVDTSAWVSDNIFSLPSTAKVGEKISVYIKAGNASYKLQIRTTAASTDTINGVVCDSVDWSSLFITGEIVTFECITVDTGWRVENDGRIPCVVSYQGQQTGVLNVTWTPVDLSMLTEHKNLGNTADVTNDELIIRRANNYAINGAVQMQDADIDASESVIMKLRQDTGGGYVDIYPWYRVENGATNAYLGGSLPGFIFDSAVGDKFDCLVYHDQDATQPLRILVTLVEVLR